MSLAVGDMVRWWNKTYRIARIVPSRLSWMDAPEPTRCTIESTEKWSAGFVVDVFMSDLERVKNYGEL